MHKIYNIFPQPIFKSEKYELKDAEVFHINQLDREKNKGGGGNQRSKTDKLLEENPMSNLKTWIMDNVKEYAFDILKVNKEHTYFYMTQSWANFNTIKTSHHKHWHANSLISGVFFVDGFKTPIRFSSKFPLFPLEFKYTEFNDLNGESYQIEMEPGRLLLFPSMLEHEVDFNDQNIQRVSISFNTWAEGNLGDKDRLTELTT
tara:strand:+ start:174 stop:782 length:609 start_codon:yes stop_codon:yes gene_type:complete